MAHSRRNVLKFGTLALGAASVPGCLWPFRPRSIEGVCPRSGGVSHPHGPLTIDTHCHVFNGTDLQVREFISRVQLRQRGPIGELYRAVASVLQGLVWQNAPTSAQELPRLKAIAAELEGCSDETRRHSLTTLAEDGYRRGRQELQRAVADDTQLRRFQRHQRSGIDDSQLDPRSRQQLDFVRQVESLPESYASFNDAAARTAERALSSRAASGMVAFVLQNFQYRYVNVHDYLKTYNRPGQRVVDLMLPSLVDYDWFLAGGGATATGLPEQVALMKQMAIATGGRVHALVAFDPLREVAFRRGHAGEGSLALVQQAVAQHGCIGVKLYPPMGFAVAGNALQGEINGRGFWSRAWLPEWTGDPRTGRDLDEAMAALCTWCEAEQVPIMAHTNVSNGPADDFEALAGPTYWKLALEAFPRLRVSFGHFGGAPTVAESLGRARKFTELMQGDGQSGAAAYADAGFFVEVLDGSNTALLDGIRQLYDETAGKGDAALANRFMYGTDWLMTLTQGPIEGYLSSFLGLLDKLEQQPNFRRANLRNLSSQFMGHNAARWLGLQQGGKARARLDAFYEAHGVPTPDWAVKVDGS
jgi:predicted TIM-barrel fold metal-dependent hydrolase